MIQAAGILTAHGGLTSHAAVVARGMGTPCVTGCEALHVDVRAKTARLPGHKLKEGDTITIDGGTGDVIVGSVPLVPPQINDDFSAVLEWADAIRRLRVRTNADNPAGRGQGTRVRRRGNRPLPDRAHVRRGRPAQPDAGDDPGRRRGRPPRRARPAAADPAGRLRGDLRGDGRPAGDDPPARLAAARVPAGARGRAGRADARADPLAARVEPDAGLAGLPARALLPGDLRDAGARDRPRRDRGARAHAARRSSRSCTRSSASARS